MYTQLDPEMAGKKEERREEVPTHRAESLGKFLNALTLLCGLYMTIVGGLLIYDGFNDGLDFDNDNIGVWINIIYSTIMGILVLGSSLKLEFVMREVSFCSSLFGRGILYLFVGSYYLNVTTGGVAVAWLAITSDAFSFDDKAMRDYLLAFIAGCSVSGAGVLFILLYIFPCLEGCCADGENKVGYAVADMKGTAIKQVAWLDILLRTVTVGVGCLLCFSCHFIWSTHFDGCVPVRKSDIDNYECRHELSKFTAIFLFDALYAGFFGITVIFAGLEWIVFSECPRPCSIPLPLIGVCA